MARLRVAAATDPLTGLPNRTGLFDRIALELARSKRTGRPVAVAVLDLDRFKEFNDVHGHLAGDRLLIAVGEALTGALRSTDLAVRFGGEEFVVLLPEIGREEATACSERIRLAVARTRVPGTDGHVTASIGLARARSGGRRAAGRGAAPARGGRGALPREGTRAGPACASPKGRSPGSVCAPSAGSSGDNRRVKEPNMRTRLPLRPPRRRLRHPRAGARAQESAGQTVVVPSLPGFPNKEVKIAGQELANSEMVGPELAFTGQVIQWEEGRSITMKFADGLTRVVPVASTMIFPPDLRPGGMLTVSVRQTADGRYRVTGLSTANPPPMNAPPGPAGPAADSDAGGPLRRSPPSRPSRCRSRPPRARRERRSSARRT